jgi:hypothetical protein
MTDVIGLAAGLFVILAFYARSQIWLRGFAIISNLLFIYYALQIKIWPVFLLHAALLPLNLLRLRELMPTTCRDLQMTEEERADFVNYACIGRDTCAFRYV